MENKMYDGVYIGKFYSVPHYWMVIFAVYDSPDLSEYIMERHVVWNEDTSKDISFAATLDKRMIPKGSSLSNDLFVMEAKDAIESMKVQWKDKFLPGEAGTIKFQIDDLKDTLVPDLDWYRLSDARFFKNGFKKIMKMTHCKQLKEHLNQVLT